MAWNIENNKIEIIMTVAQQFKNAIDLLEFIKTHPKLDKSHPKYTGKLVIGIESRSLKKEQKEVTEEILKK